MPSLLVKLLPYAGWPLFAVMFFLWLDGKENLAQQRAECNTQKVRAIAQAETVTREALQKAQERRLRDIEERLRVERESRKLAELARSDAENEALAAQETIRAMMRDADNDETATIEQACLNVNLPDGVIDRLR